MNAPLLDVIPAIRPTYDPGFRPFSLAMLRWREAADGPGQGTDIRVSVERENGLGSSHSLRLPTSPGHAEAAAWLVERVAKFLLWSRGGWRIHYEGPEAAAALLVRHYRPTGARAFDVALMSQVYERPFEVCLSVPSGIRERAEQQSDLGGHTDGCRIGFDLGASDYKIAAVRDGEAVFSEEIPWNPAEQADPLYHMVHIREGLRRAAAALPRVDAIGGSAAGIYVNNQVRVGSLYRSVPPDAFDRDIKPMFLRLREEWGVPFEVINDGEVTALAGTMSLGDPAMLGIAMGSSQAAGYINPAGHLPGWLDELAFVPVDMSPSAPADEWSGDHGVGANYFSQQAVNRLALAAGFEFPPDRRLPERLKEIQERAEAGDERARRIFEDIGIFLGYAIPWYAEFYEFRNILVLGRVMSGSGGPLIVGKATEVLSREFPSLAPRVRLHLLDEHSRRVGQAVAAASLPAIYPGPHGVQR